MRASPRIERGNLAAANDWCMGGQWNVPAGLVAIAGGLWVA